MPIIIDIKLKNGVASTEVGKIQNRMEGVWQFANNVNASIRKLNIALLSTKQIASDVNSQFKQMAATMGTLNLKVPSVRGGGSGGRSGSGSPRSAPGSNASGPAQRMLAANQRLAALQSSGSASWAQLHDAQLAARSAYSAYSKSTVLKKPPVQGLQKVINTSRAAIGPNGQMQLMPIIGQMISAGMNPSFGGVLNLAQKAAAPVGGIQMTGGSSAIGGAAIGALTGSAIAAAAALAALALALKVGTDTVGSWSRSRTLGGGSPSQARGARALSDALGIDVGAIGRNLMHGYGPVAAGAAGVNPFGGPFGDNNYNQKGMKVLDWIRNASSFDEARRRAELAGSPEAASVKLLSNDTYQNLKNSGFGGNEQDMKNVAEFNANIAIATNSIKSFAAAVAGPLISGFNKIIKGIQDSFSDVNDFLGPAFGGGGKKAKAAGSNSAKDHADALNRNTQAMNTNTRALNNIREGTFGGGGRTRGATGKGMSLIPGSEHLGYGVL